MKRKRKEYRVGNIFNEPFEGDPMKKTISILSFALFLFTAATSFALGPKINASAPDFEVKTFDGKVAKLSDYKGQYVVLEWYSSVCPCINDHYASGNIQALQKKYKEKNVAWLTVSSHAPDKQGSLSAETAKTKLLEEYKATPTQILLDHDGKMGSAYQAMSTPHIFLINPEGQLIYKGAMDQKTIDGKDYDPLKSKNYLSLALDEALSGKPISVASTTPYGCSIKYPVNEYTLK